MTNPNILDHWDLFEARTNQLFDYISSFNRLFIIASGMQEPLVNSQWPWSMNMGSIGVLLAQKLFASIDGPEGKTLSSISLFIYSDEFRSSTFSKWNTI